MTRRKPVPSDHNIRVGIEMPASVYMRLREHADLTRSSISKLCREGALRELERSETPGGDHSGAG